MIKQLPSQIANLIAAGEVVQRPSSVVKELMENAVDAGSKTIDVVVKDSGRTLIQVIDDGSGLSLKDAKTAFLRHATSKISKESDLYSIDTLGFRGEALPSIASVAQVTLRTRRAKDEVGYKLLFTESTLVSHSKSATPVGSNFEVRNLFYNVPARRKFLKSNATEFRQIVAEFSRIVLTRPELSFTLTHNDSIIHSLPPAPLKKRIQDLIGRTINRELVDIFLETPLVKISGFIGKPSEATKSVRNQYLFVNNRYFRSSYFHRAVLKGYEGLIAPDERPSYFIFFEVDLDKVDVNIHPQKSEVKFEDDYAIFDFLTSAVKESLAKNSFMPSIEFDREGAPEITPVKIGSYVPPPKVNYDPLFNPFESLSNGESRLSKGESPLNGAISSKEAEPFFKEEVTTIFTSKESHFSPVSSHLQVGGRYIITTIKSGLLLIDRKRAEERILYERYLAQLTSEITTTQKLLFPQSASLTAEDSALLSEWNDTLKRAGFEFIVGEKSVEVVGLPEDFSHFAQEPSMLLDLIISEIAESKKDFSQESRERLAEKFSKAVPSKREEQLSDIEAQAIVDRLFACREPAYTADGRKCYVVLELSQLERMFS